MNLTIIAALLLLQQATIPQQQPQPKSSIEGIVVRIGTGEPIADARVVLARGVTGTPVGALPPPALPSSLPATVSATTMIPNPQAPPGSVPTDAQGRFVIQNVEAGSYRITVAANGYARQEYGQRAFGTPGTSFNVAAGQAFKDIVIRMTPAG